MHCPFLFLYNQQTEFISRSEGNKFVSLISKLQAINLIFFDYFNDFLLAVKDFLRVVCVFKSADVSMEIFDFI